MGGLQRKVYGAVLLLSLLSFPYFFPTMARGEYPNRPIEMIVPYPAGGSGDLVMRMLSERWQEFLGQPIVLQPKVGGGGAIGSRLAAIAKPDGYTMVFGATSGFITARLGRKDAGYSLDSFRYIFQFGKLATFFVLKGDAKWKTLNDFLNDAKKAPGKMTYATSPGTQFHYTVEMLSRAAGVKLGMVPFKSIPECFAALIGGHVDMAATNTLIGMEAKGAAGGPPVRTVAVAEEKRLFNHPDAPTLKELGYPIVVYSSLAVCAPKGIPEEVVRKWEDAHRKAMEKYGKEIEEKMLKIDVYPHFLDGKATMKLFHDMEKGFIALAPQMGIK